MTVSNQLADFFLFFDQIEVVCLIALLGFVFMSRPLFFQVICLSFIDLVVNVSLKGTFKMPLSPVVEHTGYAFPSGHMQFATVFYIWLFVYIAWLPLRLVIPFLLVGIGASMIHYGYHCLYDVLGGFLFGLILVFMYQHVLLHWRARAPWILLLFTSSLMVYNACVYIHIPIHATLAYALLFILVLLERWI